MRHLKRTSLKKLEKLLNFARLRDNVIMSLSIHEEKEEKEISIIEGRTRKRPINVGVWIDFL